MIDDDDDIDDDDNDLMIDNDDDDQMIDLEGWTECVICVVDRRLWTKNGPQGKRDLP